MKITLIVYDKEENVIGRSINIFGDPRIKSREMNASSVKYFFDPVSTFRAGLQKSLGRNISQVFRVEILAIEVENS